VELRVVETIGVEMGDSNYVLGAVQGVDHDLDGNILVLDRSYGCVRAYSPEGEFIRQISREGSGPGEIQNPLTMTVVGDGRVFVQSPFTGGMNAFSSDGEWLGVVTPFFMNPPMTTYGADSNAYIGVKVTIAVDDEGLNVVDTFIGRYEEGEEPVVRYWEDEFPFDPTDLTTLLRNSVMCNVFNADRDGNVFIARCTNEEYLVRGFRADGELFLEIEEEALQVEKTPEEIAEEETYLIAYLESIGAGGVLMEYTANPYRDTISEIELDGENRIWIRRGTSIEPVFDVYDYSGEKLFSATVPEAGDGATYWDFNIDEKGIIAYSVNPELFQQVYVLEMSE